MAFAVQAASGINTATLDKHAANGIERLHTRLVFRYDINDPVQVSKDSAVKEAKDPVFIFGPFRVLIFRHRKASFFSDPLE